jgi:hypothetical protein
MDVSPRQRRGGDAKERRWENDDEAILAAKVGMRLRGAGAGCIMYLALPFALAVACGVGERAARQRPMTTKDPRRLRHWRHRGTWGEGSAKYINAAVHDVRYAMRRYRSHWPRSKKVWWGRSLSQRAKGSNLR